jgi:hypothetical protein
VLVASSTADHVVSRTLADEVKHKIREQGLVLWLDAEGQYTDVVDALAQGAHDFEYPVVAFRGSFLEVMLGLEGYGNDLQPEHVLVHLPGMNEETVQETPLFEFLRAGTPFDKKLNTLIKEAARGLARPEEVEELLREPGLSVAKADLWLEQLREQPRDGLGVLLDTLGLDDVVMGVIVDDARFHKYLPESGEPILAFLSKGLGLSTAWREFRIGSGLLNRANLASLVAGWLMAVEFVQDLKEAPATKELQALTSLDPYATECRRLAVRLREQRPDVYRELANELQEYLAQERTSHHARALGSIDTFRFEEAATRAAALSALIEGKWEHANDFASARTTEGCFWVKDSVSLQRSWEIIRLAATTGRKLDETEKALEHCGSLEEAVERYASKLAPVDRQHRLFEQRTHALLASDLEDYDRLLQVRVSVRRAYRVWADAINRRFHELCVRCGVLPEPDLRQRTVYERVVHPLLEQGRRVAFVLVDALRFEMAQGFAAELKNEKFNVSLSPRFAELPTDTKIGMNALAPVERNGRLRLVVKKDGIEGFAAGEYTVSDPASRVRAMSQRSVSGIAEDIVLEEFQDLSLTQLKRRLSGKPALVVVHSRELDTAGEHGLHLGTFDQTLALLKSAISLLSQAGIERIVVASDHGFLLQDATAENVPFGDDKRMPQRRHALLPQPSGMPDVLELRLSALEYDLDTDQYLVLRPDTALWRTKDKIAPFVHGGNSLQERVIPVLIIERPGSRGKTLTKYEVVAQAEPAQLGRQRLRLAVRLQERQTGALGFIAPKSISLSLRVPGRSELTVSLLDAGPPAELSDGRILLPPNRGEAVVEFELEGEINEKVRVEVFHPDAQEDVTSKIVEGFFDVARNRRLGKVTLSPPGEPTSGEPASGEPAAVTASAVTTSITKPVSLKPPPEQGWADSIENADHLRVFEIIETQRSINEAELASVLGSPRHVRAFSRQYEALVSRLPFGIEVCTVNGLKTYVRKD